MLKRLLRPIVEVREEELWTVLLMFSYSFLAMSAYNIVQPITRSRFISALGAQNLPYVLLVSVFIIGLIMQAYSKLGRVLPSRWIIPATQLFMVTLLLGFWTMFGRGVWVEVAFYLFGQFYGLLLISQFWTLANLVFDPRQAKRVFGFIGGGASLGGIVGGSITAFLTQQFGNRQLVLVSAIILAACVVVVLLITGRRRSDELKGLEEAGKEEGVGGQEALRMLRDSKHLQIIAAVIALTSIAAGIVDQQLNMATQAFKGQDGTDAMAQVLARVQVWVSVIGFVIQVWLTSRIQRLLGVGFALLLLPVSFVSTAVAILLLPVLNAAVSARIVDKALRYTVDKTTREILFLPLPSDIKQKAKPFVDVTVDRFARAVVALLLLVLIAPWGLNLEWWQLSLASLGVTLLWIVTALAAKRRYRDEFVKSLMREDVKPGQIRVADLSTIETLMEELADPNEARVLNAIDVLESLEKRNLVTPLLLYHESPSVRARALAALSQARPAVVARWQPQVQRMLGDTDTQVRVAAMGALASMRQEDVTALIEPYLDDDDPRLASAAAMVLARSANADDAQRAEAVLARLAGDTSEAAAPTRREVAVAVRQVADARFHHLLIPLLYDADPSVSQEALRSVRQVGSSSFLFVPALVQLLRNRRLKGPARDVLVGYGEDVVESLAYFLNDPDEDIWVRRHIPATLARIPSQKSMDALAGALATATDGFLRFKLIAAMDRLHRERPELTFDRKPLEALVLKEGARYFEYLGLHYNLFDHARLPDHAILARALREKAARARSRVYLVLGLLYPWKDITAARWTIEHGDAKARSGAIEYLDNVLAGPFRKRLLPIFEDMSLDERVRRGNSLLDTRVRNVEETLLQLINDDDQVVAACAIHLAAQTQTWSLADDIEHVLEHRDARDWYVFEAASWALAEHRMPAERRRALWLEPLPAVEFASRLSALPLFARTSVDELFRLAGASQQLRHEPGKVLYAEGTMPRSVQFLLDGTVTLTSKTGETVAAAPPAPLAFDEAVQGLPMEQTVRTDDTCVTLALTVEEWRTLLANSTPLVQGLFETILEHPAFAARRVVVPGKGTADLSHLASEGVSPVERVLALQRIDLFARFPADELVQLANTARAISFKTGDRLFVEADPPAIHVVVGGVLSLEAEGQPEIRADAGDAIGIYEALAGVSVGRRCTAIADGAALRIDHDDLFDAVGQRPDLMRNLFTALLGTRAQVGTEAA